VIRRVLLVVALGVVAVALYFGAVMLASELGGEVVVLHTRGDDGSGHATSLWVVEDEGALWLRAGVPESGWLERLERRPEVELERGGRTIALRAVPVPQRRDRIHALMRERYGWADVLVASLPGRDPQRSVPVRLEPR